MQSGHRGASVFRQAGYLHSSELNHRPDALRNHVEVLGSLWGHQGKIGIAQLHRGRKKKYL